MRSFTSYEHFKSRWVGGYTVIIGLVSVQIGLNWYWTGTELGKIAAVSDFQTLDFPIFKHFEI